MMLVAGTKLGAMKLSRLGGVRAARRNPEPSEGSDAEHRNKVRPL